MNLNQVNIFGNFTRDPEARDAGSSRVVKFGIAANGRRYKDKSTGEYKQDVTFVDCEAWGDVGRVIEEHFTKGRPILITSAELAQDNWDDKETGKKRSKHFLRVKDFTFVNLGGKREEGDDAPAETEAPAKKTGGRKKKAVEATEEAAEGGDETIPF